MTAVAAVACTAAAAAAEDVLQEVQDEQISD
jgi:hypothetical protein